MGKSKENGMKKRKNKLNYIRNLIEEQKYKRALYEIEKYIDVYPDDTFGHYLYGKLLYRKNELQPARRQFQLVAEYQDENEVKALMHLASIARKESDPDEAIKYYKKVIEDSSYQDIYAINVLAHLYRYEKRSYDAIELLNKCPHQPELIKELAKNLSIVGMVQEALTLLETISPETKAQERDISLNKGRVAVANDDYERAMFYFENAKEKEEKDAIYYKAVYEQVKLLINYENYEQAIKYCEDLLSINNHFNGEIYLLMGKAKQGVALYEEAYNNYLKASELGTDRDVRAEAYYLAGSLDFAKGNFYYAETLFKRSSANARNVSEQTYTKLIGVLLRQEKYSEVLKYVERIKKILPQNWKDSPIEYVEMLVNKKIGKKMPPRDSCAYAERQIIKYKEQEAIEHIESHHTGASKTRGNFSKNVNIEELYYDIRSNLKDAYLVNEDAMDIYEIDYPNIGYDLENNLVHRVRVVVLPTTKNILTMYPGCRATVPRKGEITWNSHHQNTKKSNL